MEPYKDQTRKRHKAQIPLCRLPRVVRDKPVTSPLALIPLRRFPRNFPGRPDSRVNLMKQSAESCTLQSVGLLNAAARLTCMCSVGSQSI